MRSAPGTRALARLAPARRWGPPARGLPRARWYYLVYNLWAGAACVPGLLSSTPGSRWQALLGGAGVLCLGAVRVTEYARGRLLPSWAELPQAAALTVAAVAAGPLDAGVGLFYAGCFFRVLYASTGRTLLTTVGAIALLGACSPAAGADWERLYVSHAFGLATTTLLTRMLLGTLLQQNEDVLRHERLLQAVFGNLDVAVIVQGRDPEARTLMNAAAHELHGELGLPEAPEPWDSTVEVYAGDGTTRLRPEQMPAERALRGDRVHEMAMVLALPDGGRRHFLVNAARLPRAEADPGVVLTVTDVTSRVQAEMQLAHLALHDVLTGLANRTSLSEEMTRWLSDASPRQQGFAVVLLDLDGFKRINDSLGHARGDEVLQAVAARLRTCIRPEDVLARLGGDEFAVLCADAGAALLVADRICAAVREPVELGRTRVALSTSVGIAYVDGGQTHGEALAAADLAMYAAKAAGPGQVREFHPELRVALDERLALEGDLHRALERGEFELHYQPYVNMETGCVIGAEALVRWRTAQGRLVPPLDFIPLVEDNGMVVPLGRWVLRTACRAAAGWQPPDQARVVTVSVNVSGRQLDDPDFVTDVAQVLAETGLTPRALTLEITESVFLSETSLLHTCLTGLKALGVRIAVDDFGTGYSSLSRLQRFPVDILKIDRSFVGEIDSSTGSALVATIVALADALVLEVVAEGVESRAQVDALLARGCRVAQGFHFGRPALAPFPGVLAPQESPSVAD